MYKLKPNIAPTVKNTLKRKLNVFKRNLEIANTNTMVRAGEGDCTCLDGLVFLNFLFTKNKLKINK